MASETTSGRRYLLYGLLIVGLGIGYLFMFSNMGFPSIPFGGDIASESSRAEATRAELVKQQKLYRHRLEELAQVRQLASFVYPADTDANAIVRQIEKLAYDSGMSYSSLRRIGGRSEENSFLRTEEVTINGQVDIKQLAIFLKEIENSRPLLEWSMFSVTPRPNQPSPNLIYISGRIKAYLLTDEAGALLSGEVMQ